MIKHLLVAVGIIVALLSTAYATGYFEYRERMNLCLNNGGIVIKLTSGIKCVPTSEVKLVY